MRKWLLSLMLSLLFLLISSPFSYKIIGNLTKELKFTTSENGCANLYGLLIHTFVFFLLCLLIVNIVSNKEKYGYPYFKGIVKPENMLAVNNLRIQARDKGCIVDHVIEEVQLDPYNKNKSKKAVEYCRKNCPGLSERGLQILENIPSWQDNLEYNLWSY